MIKKGTTGLKLLFSSKEDFQKKAIQNYEQRTTYHSQTRRKRQNTLTCSMKNIDISDICPLVQWPSTIACMGFSITTSPQTSSAPYSGYRPVANTYMLTQSLLGFCKQQEDSGTIQARNKEHREKHKKKRVQGKNQDEYITKEDKHSENDCRGKLDHWGYK